MNDARRPAANEEEQTPAGGLNLKLIYGLIILAMLAALVVAALIVLPFYSRR